MVFLNWELGVFFSPLPVLEVDLPRVLLCLALRQVEGAVTGNKVLISIQVLILSSCLAPLLL